MNRRLMVLAAAVVLLAGGVLMLVTAASLGGFFQGGGQQQAGSNSSSDPPPGSDEPWITRFTLTDQSGKPFGTSDLEGSVWVASFFFASCPTICKLQNGEIAKVAREFGPQGVKFVSITCDPEADTVARLGEYSKQFQVPASQWRFLTGNLAYIRRIAAEYFRVAVDRQTHTERLIVVDAAGNIHGGFHWNEPADLERLKESLSALLAGDENPQADQ